MRYMGGKFKIASELAGIINAHTPGRVYIEPFMGACHVLVKIVAAKRIAYDAHCELVSMWQRAIAGWLPPVSVSRDEYQLAMDGHFDDAPHLKAFILFGASYGARYRGGYAGDGARNYALVSRRAVMEYASRLGDVDMACRSFFNLSVPSGAVVYCDPPYQGTVGYLGVEKFNHDDFWESIRQWVKNDNLVFVSEYQAPDDFVSIWKKSQYNTIDQKLSIKNEENLFVHCTQLSRIKRRQYSMLDYI